MSSHADVPQNEELNPNRNPITADETTGITAVTIGSGLWAIGLIWLLIDNRDHRLDNAGHGHWIWIAFSGLMLGIFGQLYTRRRAAKIAAGVKHELF